MVSGWCELAIFFNIYIYMCMYRIELGRSCHSILESEGFFLILCSSRQRRGWYGLFRSLFQITLCRFVLILDQLFLDFNQPEAANKITRKSWENVVYYIGRWNNARKYAVKQQPIEASASNKLLTEVAITRQKINWFKVNTVP